MPLWPKLGGIAYHWSCLADGASSSPNSASSSAIFTTSPTSNPMRADLRLYWTGSIFRSWIRPVTSSGVKPLLVRQLGTKGALTPLTFCIHALGLSPPWTWPHKPPSTSPTRQASQTCGVIRSSLGCGGGRLSRAWSRSATRAGGATAGRRRIWRPCRTWKDSPGKTGSFPGPWHERRQGDEWEVCRCDAYALRAAIHAPIHISRWSLPALLYGCKDYRGSGGRAHDASREISGGGLDLSRHAGGSPRHVERLGSGGLRSLLPYRSRRGRQATGWHLDAASCHSSGLTGRLRPRTSGWLACPPHHQRRFSSYPAAFAV